MKKGLVSVTFRKLSVPEIIKLASENDLEYIEWGGDCHVKMGKVSYARKVKKLMNAYGIKCESYGSYYGVVYKSHQHPPLRFKQVCKTALALGAKTIRIWPGWPGCGEIDEAAEAKAVLHTREISKVAKKYGVTLAFECHFGTITDDYKRTLSFMKKIGCDNVKMYWQPNPFKSKEYNMEALKALKPYLTNVHVCQCINGVKDTLESAFDEWSGYIKEANDDENRLFLLEFMPDNEPSSLPSEAKTLRKLEENAK